MGTPTNYDFTNSYFQKILSAFLRRTHLNLGLEASFGKTFRVLVKNEEMIPRNRTFRGQNETQWSQGEQDVRLRNGESAKIHPFPLLIIFQNLIALTKQQAQYF
ncbi:hypothetical protein [Leptospira interrogans]|uniref:hypothetical protein n=1 Tax=Leptospira interrogans TaxID=173 RepID=UPI00077462EE|nr:hypothetical protein [Leptospira interrogans]WOT12332.1 hypothetical protein CFY92_0007740 [Leptospira interrogans]